MPSLYSCHANIAIDTNAMLVSIDFLSTRNVSKTLSDVIDAARNVEHTCSVSSSNTSNAYVSAKFQSNNSLRLAGRSTNSSDGRAWTTYQENRLTLVDLSTIKIL